MILGGEPRRFALLGLSAEFADESEKCALYEYYGSFSGGKWFRNSDLPTPQTHK